jgi:hypothetical protein
MLDTTWAVLKTYLLVYTPTPTGMEPVSPPPFGKMTKTGDCPPCLSFEMRPLPSAIANGKLNAVITAWPIARCAM